MSQQRWPKRVSSMSKNIENRDRLIVALDVPTSKQAIELVDLLGERVSFYKIGLELFMSGEYFELLDQLSARGKKIFVDLKFFDVPATVGRAVAQLNGKGVTFATVHGNDSIMRAAADNKGDVQILAVTVLTSLDRGDLDDLGFKCDVAELVLSRARRAVELGCDGVVASGQEASAMREKLGDSFMVVTPGIRPVDNDDDQKRVVTAEQAFTNGADYIVVGRPIRDAQDPRAAAEALQAEINAVFS
ncbi:MAG: orotidine-5'-phosphate decarboxylase [Gammaproteobacteria bacterium]|nr:orotidine-5'-phosphate decarboxylase [Gammaproteobacteria bacterium]